MRVFNKALQFKSGLIGIILSLICLSGFGQYSETLYGTDEGLSHPAVLDIEEDEDGFIWVFTFFGLNRFDGYGFREYMVEDSSYSRRLTYMGGLLKDALGRIWVDVGTAEAFIIDLESDRVHLTTPEAADFRDIEEGDEGSWILTDRKSIYLVSEKPGLAFEYEKWQVPEEAWIIKYLFKLKDGTFLATSYYGLFRLTFGNDSILAEKIHMEDHLKKDFKIDMDTRIFSVNDEIYLLTGNEILKTNFNGQGIDVDSVYSLSLLELDFPEIGLINGQPISAVIKGRDNEIFIRSLNGIYSYNLLSGKAERIRAENNGIPDNSEGNYLEALYYSTEGILWAGTDKGLLKIVIGNKPFHTLLSEPDNPDDVTTTKLGGPIVDNKKDLWCGGGDGLYQFRKSIEGDYRKINHYLPDTSDPFSISEKYIAPMFEDSKMRLWFGIYGRHDVQWMDLNSPGKFHSTLARKYAAQTGYPLDASNIIEDPQGHILILSFAGMFWLLEPDLSEAYALVLDSAFNRIRDPYMARSGDKQLYLLNRGHLYNLPGEYKKRIYHSSVFPDDSLWKKYSSTWELVPSAYPVGMKDIFTLDPAYSVDSRFTIAGSGSGQEAWISVLTLRKLLGINITTSDFRMLPPEKERLLEQSFAILEDKKGRIWNATADGLFCFNPETELCFYYYMDDGLPDSKFSYGGCLDEDGFLYLSTENGIVYFNPDSILPDPAPEVILTDFRLFHESIKPDSGTFLPASISKINTIRLNFRQNFIGIGFTSSDYRNTERIHFKYMLEGLDKDWIMATNNRLAEYPNLKPGRYTFRIIAANGNGVWNRSGTTLDIRVLPPLWFRWWAIMTEILLAVAGLIIYIRYREKELKHRAILLEKKVDEKTRQVLEQRKEVDELKSRFYTNISHEFRTPLTLILGPLEQGGERKAGRISFHKDVVAVMQRNARRLQLLINQLLDVSKLETGKMKLQVSDGDFEGFVRTLVLSFLSLAESKKIKYTYDIPQSSTGLFFDPDKLEKILTNLISNAFKFTPEGGEVGVRLDYITADSERIASEKYGSVEFAEIRISDTGKGIPADKLELIFDRFYQISGSDTREQEGSGIGLALTRELLDLYRGEIHVRSEPGQGSTFTLKLPVSKESFKEGEIVEVPSVLEKEPGEEVLLSMTPDKSGLHEDKTGIKSKDDPVILIVEDNMDLRDYISRNLVSPYQILEAENGKEGLQKSLELIPDLVITDLMMPEMDGMEMCRRLKEDERTSHIPVIMLTAKADRESKLKGLKTGADDYLIKPFDPEELQVRTRNLIEQRRKLRAKFLEEFRIKPIEETMGVPGDKLLHRVLDILSQYIDDPQYNVDHLTGELNMSRSQMFRKIRALTGNGPGELLRNLRLKKAAELILNGKLNITQIMYQVGFQNTSNFARQFKEYFGVNPSGYKRSLMN